MALVALVPGVIAVAQLGRLHPDEVYQLLEPAFTKAFGYGVVAWEWQTGLRNWALPGFFAYLLKLCSALGIDHPWAYRAVLEVPQALLHGLSLWAVFRLVERRAGRWLGLWAAMAVGLYAPVMTFAGRTLGESFSGSFLLVAVDWLDRERGRWWVWAGGGAMLGLAVVARYASAVMVAAAVAWLAGWAVLGQLGKSAERRQRWGALGWAVAGGLVVAAGLGALDWATWGRPFHSFLTYVDFNVLSGRAAAQFGSEPPGFYRLPFLATFPLWGWPGLAMLLRWGRPKLSLPLFCGVAYLVALVLTDHKEHRFLYPGLVLLCLAAATGWAEGFLRLRRPELRSALAALCLFVSAAPWFLEGPLDVQRPDQFRAIVKASRGATGLLVVGEGLWGAGGHFYLGQNIPWFTCDWPSDPAFVGAMADRRFNRVVTYDERALAEARAGGFEVVERIGRATWLRRP